MPIEIRVKKNEYGEINFVAFGEDKDFICSECEKLISEGFVCENNSKKVLCEECQKVYPMYRCRAGSGGVHNHLKFKRIREE